MKFKVFNLPIHVNSSFLIVVAILSAMNSGNDSRLMVFRFVALFSAVLVHELGHALVARWYGMKPEIELNFIGGQASWVELKRLDYRKRCLITFAGPGVGLLFGVIFYGLVFFVHALPPVMRDFLREHYYYYFLLNIFNLIPIYPMDGAQGLEFLIGWVKGHVNQLTVHKISFNTAVVCVGLSLYVGQWPIALILGYFGYMSYRRLKA